MGQADILRALAGRSKEDFWGGGMGIFFKEVMLNFPGVVIAKAICQLELIERIVVQLPLSMRLPGAGNLQLIKNAEFHGIYPSRICAYALQ